MKILLIHNLYQQPGGEDAVFDNERRLLEEAGHEVSTYVRSNSEIDALNGLQKIILPARSAWAIDARREITQILRLEKHDVVHVHNTFTMISPSIYSACAASGIPVVQTLHNYRLVCPAGNFFRANQVCEECVDHGAWHSLRYGCYHNSRAVTSVVVATMAFHSLLGTWHRNIARFIALTEFARGKYIEAGLSSEKIVVKPNFLHDP